MSIAPSLNDMADPPLNAVTEPLGRQVADVVGRPRPEIREASDYTATAENARASHRGGRRSWLARNPCTRAGSSAANDQIDREVRACSSPLPQCRR
jgi:hypothetical protein